MIPQFQNIIDPKEGNCINACVASLTEIPLDEFPKTKLSSDDYYADLFSFLDQHGWIYFEVKMHYFFPYYVLKDLPLIVSVPSQLFKGKTRHAVIARVHNGDWELLHDPNPKNKPYDLSKIKIKKYDLVVKKDAFPTL